MTTSACEYLLSRHAYICVVPDHIVVLDLGSGKYLALNAAQARSLQTLVRGWPQVLGNGEETDVLHTLLERGLLTANPEQGKSASPVTNDPPVAWIGEFRPPGRPRIYPRHVWRFAKAALTAAICLRVLSMRNIVLRVTRRKKARRGRAELSTNETLELLRVFDWLRPLAFHKKDTCLLYSLTMLEFLAYYGVFPDWIFGVRLRPFKAHCWLQMNEHAMTDIPFNIGALTPIMVV